MVVLQGRVLFVSSLLFVIVPLIVARFASSWIQSKKQGGFDSFACLSGACHAGFV